ncbi:MAG: type III secretion system export apparatus subunit SctU [Myxococcaceae bacterium]
MAQQQSGEKTEEPTHKKLEDARKKGQTWKSKDLTGVFVFLVGMGALWGAGDFIAGELRSLFAFAFDALSHPDTLHVSIRNAIGLGLRATVLLTLPVVVAAAVIGALSDFIQTGGLFSMESIQPKLEKLNPIEGLKNLFSKKQLVELLKSTVKMGVTAYVVYVVLRDGMDMVVGSIRGDPAQLLSVLGELIFRICVRVGVLFILFGVFDVWFQRRTYMKDMMMTKDEVKREYKESEGDPHHKQKRKEFHMEILEGAQMEAVKDADVVVTNPEHVAVALKYDTEKDHAPRVIAKGMNARAQAMKALARDSNVALMRNVPLAHALLRVEVGEEIPESLYDAVAEVLNFVYSLRQGTLAAAQ